MTVNFKYILSIIDYESVKSLANLPVMQTPVVNGRSIKELSRPELQQLFKSYGLKGANAKVPTLSLFRHF